MAASFLSTRNGRKRASRPPQPGCRIVAQRPCSLGIAFAHRGAINAISLLRAKRSPVSGLRAPHHAVATDRARLPSQVARQSVPTHPASPLYCRLIERQPSFVERRLQHHERRRIEGAVVEAAHCFHPQLYTDDFARLANARRKLGQVCDPRWTISRPNDHTFLA